MLTIPAGPERLPAAPPHGPAEASSLTSRPPVRGFAIPIRVQGVPDELRADRGAGIATFQAETGADFTWSPLSAATAGADGSLLVTTTAFARGEIVITLASDRRFARHGYVARRSLVPPASGVTTALVDFPVQTGTVLLRLREPAASTTSMRLLRRDDPLWLPMQQGGSGLVLPVGGELRLLLGAGDYELQDPLDATRRVQFSVPSAAPIDVSAVRKPAPTDRP